MALTGKKIGNTYKTLLAIESVGGSVGSTFDGLTSDLKKIADGNGVDSNLKLSTTKAQIIPSSNAVDTLKVTNTADQHVFSCDTTNRKILVGRQTLNPMMRTENFFIWTPGTPVTDRWKTMFHQVLPERQTGIDLGGGSTPSETITWASTALDYSGPWFDGLAMFRLQQDITITNVYANYVARSATGGTYTASGSDPVIEACLMYYKSSDAMAGVSGAWEGGVQLSKLAGDTVTATTKDKQNIMTLISADADDGSIGSDPAFIIGAIKVNTAGTNKDIFVKISMDYTID